MPSKAISANSTASGARWMNRPVMIEFATFQYWLASNVSGFSGVAPRSVRSLPVALEPTTTSLPFQRFFSSFVCPARRWCSCHKELLNWLLASDADGLAADTNQCKSSLRHRPG